MQIRIPKTGDAVEDGTVAEWLVADGARVQKGTPLYILETDKSEMEIESPCAGTIRIAARVGETLPVGALVATIEESPG
jgi:pyruvate/2-oxoglutarate dehydrogenase complex dihydrolipoamide acyltransferase (E2) component